jgi:hypothetical protein
MKTPKQLQIAEFEFALPALRRRAQRISQGGARQVRQKYRHSADLLKNLIIDGILAAKGNI